MGVSGKRAAPVRISARANGASCAMSARVALVTSTPWAGRSNRGLQRLGGIDPMAAIGGVGDAPVMSEHRLEPIDEQGVVRLFLQSHAAWRARPEAASAPAGRGRAARPSIRARSPLARSVRLVVEQILQRAWTRVSSGASTAACSARGGGNGRWSFTAIDGRAGGAFHAAVAATPARLLVGSGTSVGRAGRQGSFPPARAAAAAMW